MIRLTLCLVLLAATITVAPDTALSHGAGHHHGSGHNPGKAAAGQAQAYAFPLAKPGSYELPPIKAAAGGDVLDEHGRRHDLRTLVTDRMTVLAFVYTRCGDICPLATLRMADLRELAAARPGLARDLRFVSMSFDPEYDTPARMAEHAELWRQPDPAAPEWHFVTAPDVPRVQPILEAYGQVLAPKADPHDPDGPIRHILRVFLIDRGGVVRNIYSLDFLDPDLVMNDIATLLIEEEDGRGRGLRAATHGR